ncbi:MAG: hypothetical protein MJ252_00805 [archaeon]|nr:hypothetical protein [archaeon]
MGTSNVKEGDLVNFVNPFEGPKNQSKIKNISKTLKSFFSRNTSNNFINKKFSSSFSLDKEEANKSYNKLLSPQINDLDDLFLVELSKSTDEGSSTGSDYKDITEEFSKKSGKNFNSNTNYIHADDLMTLPQKSNETLRKEYYSKLICTKVLSPYKKEKQFKTIFIFDWDDTLFCSSFIFPNGSNANDKRITQKDMQQIATLDEIVNSILTKSLTLGEVYIITNASCGWVEFASSRFYKKSLNVIPKIKVISARNKNEKLKPGLPKMWKSDTFISAFEKQKFFGILNLISVGDSVIEMEAAKNLCNSMRNCVLKTVKMQEAPSLKDLIKQLELIDNRLDKIYSAPKNLTIRVEKKKIEE